MKGGEETSNPFARYQSASASPFPSTNPFQGLAGAGRPDFATSSPFSTASPFKSSDSSNSSPFVFRPTPGSGGKTDSAPGVAFASSMFADLRLGDACGPSAFGADAVDSSKVEVVDFIPSEHTASHQGEDNQLVFIRS